MYVFDFTIGDHGDGHNQKEIFTLSSNVSALDLTCMYLETVKKIGKGLDSQNKGPCSDYEDNSIDLYEIEELGLDPKKYNLSEDYVMSEDPADNDGTKWNPVYSDEFVDLFIDYMKTHNPDLELKLLPSRDSFPAPIGNIGLFGYGLFY